MIMLKCRPLLHQSQSLTKVLDRLNQPLPRRARPRSERLLATTRQMISRCHPLPSVNVSLLLRWRTFKCNMPSSRILLRDLLNHLTPTTIPPANAPFSFWSPSPTLIPELFNFPFTVTKPPSLTAVSLVPFSSHSFLPTKAEPVYCSSLLLHHLSNCLSLDSNTIG